MTAEPESFLSACIAEGMAVLLGTCGVSGFSEVLDPQSCLTHGLALTRLPKHLHPTSWWPSQEPDGLGVWKHEDRRFQGNLHTCSLSRADPELRVLQPVQSWWSLASATVKRHCCYRPDCPLLSAAVRVPRECILLRDHKCTNIAERRQCRISFFTYISVFLSLLMQDKFSLLQKSLFPKTPELPCNEKTRACERCRFYQRLKAPSSGARVSLQGTEKFWLICSR